MSPSPSTRAPWEEGFLWGEGREGGKSCGGSEHLSAGFTPAQQPSKALSVSVFLVSVHVNTPPVLPSSRPPPPLCLWHLCLSRVTLTHLSPPHCLFLSPTPSHPFLLFKLCPSSRELQVWTAGLGHR